MEEIHAPYVQKCLVDEDPFCITLVRLIVKPAHRGKGVGGRIVQQVKERARRVRKPVRLMLDPEDESRRADLVRFYRRHGFRLERDNETMICYT